MHQETDGRIERRTDRDGWRDGWTDRYRWRQMDGQRRMERDGWTARDMDRKMVGQREMDSSNNNGELLISKQKTIYNAVVSILLYF